MANSVYTRGKNTFQNHVPQGGPKYSAGKNSSIARGISAGKSGTTKIDVGYSKGQASKGENWKPDAKNRSTPFKQGGRS